MEFLVEFELEVPAGTPHAEVEQRRRDESAAAAKLAEDGHLVRLWRRPLVGDGTTAIGLYRADSEAELDDLLGALLYVQSRGVRHGSAEVLARLGRGEDVNASEYTFRTSTQIETAAADLDWLNKGVFIGVAGRKAERVIYETYLVA